MLKHRMWLRPQTYKMGMGCFCQVNTYKIYLYLDGFRNTDSTIGSSWQAAGSVSGCCSSKRAALCRKSRSESQQRRMCSLSSEQSLAAHIHHRSASSCLFFCPGHFNKPTVVKLWQMVPLMVRHYVLNSTYSSYQIGEHHSLMQNLNLSRFSLILQSIQSCLV